MLTRLEISLDANGGKMRSGTGGNDRAGCAKTSEQNGAGKELAGCAEAAALGRRGAAPRPWKGALAAMLAAVLLGGCTAKDAVLSFSSFDGSGTVFTVVTDTEIVSHACRKKYPLFHGREKGAHYDMVCTFTGRKPGETALSVQQRSPVAGSYDHVYAVLVDEGLNVTVEFVEVRKLERQE